MHKALIVGAMGLAAALAAAPQAVASTVTVSRDNTLRVLESGNESNRIAVSYDATANLYTVADAAAALHPSGDCMVVDTHTAICPGAGIKTISVGTGARDDAISLDPVTIPGTVTENLDGGADNDQVSGGHGTLTGSSGNDVVVGGPTAENIRGGSGRDLLDGGDGPDDIEGGRGTDTLVYPANRQTPIAVTIGAGNFSGGVEDQGPAGRDTVHGDIEVVIGTAQDDLLAGDGSSETLDGAGGNDTLVGDDGNDTLLGLEGDDLLFGGRGRDLLRGWLGADRLFGGADNDFLAGGPDDDLLVGKRGHDVMKGKGGIDRIHAKDGTVDLKINCGPGSNRAESAKWDRGLDPRPRSC